MNSKPELIPVFEAKVKIGDAQLVGSVHGYQRRIVPVLGGEVFGENIRGEILEGGSDWQQIHDNQVRIETRYTIKTSDNHLIYMVNRGIRLTKQNETNTPETYMRTHTFFEVEKGPYQWLNESLFLSTSQKTNQGIHHQFYQLT
ncbi:DUF3237 domain-containing protein [Flavobacteriaceae bacterium XHP0103]|uniref:DUF3237 domain-containing protein n=1 Tax=Marixanthotalea marina TaxID=2844359 RepID=UPI002989F204|nr:DUF3237 domain-containing protein [Marixanthotalea marina]MBU3820770.1 DUF3237 domain-containing protein [Marixanthotalea marina]